MSTQTKQFIQPSDILAVVFECNNCHAKVTLPVAKSTQFGALGTCPNCQTPWLHAGQNTCEPVLTKCTESIAETVDRLERWEEILKASNSKGFSLTLEISPDKNSND